MSRNIFIALVLFIAALLGFTAAQVYNHLCPTMQWEHFNERADAIDLHNAMTTCTPIDDKWVCLTFKAAMRTECTADACGPITEVK